MTRRLIIAIVATVMATLVVAGLGTLALTARAARDSAEKDLRLETTQLASAVAENAAENARPLQFLLNLRKALRIEDAGIVQLARPNPAGLPQGITLEDILVDRLRDGSVVSGRRGGLVFAAA